MDFTDCVSKDELVKSALDERAYFDGKFTEMMTTINNLVTRLEHLERPPHHRNRIVAADDGDDDELVEEDDAAGRRDARDARLRDRLQHNRRGMGGNREHGNNDSFARPKFTMLPFAGTADPEAYLDWELAVEQKFNSHLVSEEHRVRLATSEFTSFALFWWNDLCTANNNNANAIPQTWNALKQRMKSRFVPPYYQHDLHLKLQTLQQGEIFVEEYYQALIIGLARCDICDNDADTCARFFGGLNHDIQDILDYKDWNRFNQLYHLALKAEREIQGRRQQQHFHGNSGRSFPPRPTTSIEKSSPPVAMPPAPEVSKTANVQVSTAKKPSSKPSTSGSSSIVCHRCKGMGHVMRDCPSTRAYIATNDGGYESASDVEDEHRFAANLLADEQDTETEVIESLKASEGFESLLVQRVLSTQVEPAEPLERLQRQHLFNCFLIVKGFRVHAIIDSGSCNNLVSSDLVEKLGLTTRAIEHPYQLQWFNNNGKTKVTRSATVHFSI